jgi:hypothetical protein
MVLVFRSVENEGQRVCADIVGPRRLTGKNKKGAEAPFEKLSSLFSP